MALATRTTTPRIIARTNQLLRLMVGIFIPFMGFFPLLPSVNFVLYIFHLTEQLCRTSVNFAIDSLLNINNSWRCLNLEILCSEIGLHLDEFFVNGQTCKYN